MTLKSMSSISKDWIVRLAYFAQRAYCFGSHRVATVPSNSQMGLDIDPVELATDDASGVVSATTAIGKVIAFRVGRSLEAYSLSEVVTASLNWFDGRMRPLGPDVPGSVRCDALELLDHLWPAVLPVALNAAGDITFVGHGQGGALATLAAVRTREVFPSASIQVLTFGSTAVGDEQFSNFYKSEINHHLRFEVEDDLVPHLPLDPLASKLILPNRPASEKAAYPQCSHVGRLRYFDGQRWLSDAVAVAQNRNRRFRLFQLLLACKNAQLALSDHSLPTSYLSRLQNSCDERLA